jgi:hypothetical protein
MSRLSIETGHVVTKDIARVDATAVRFVSSDGRTMFEVSARDDGRSIEVRGVDACMVDGILYASSIDVRPFVGNCIAVMVRKYEETQ